MSDERRVDREGIHIDRDLADQIAIEEELDSNVEGEFAFPSPRRRRIAAWVYIVAGAVSLLTIDGGWLIAIAFGVLAIWHWVSAWPLAIDEHQALGVAAQTLDFPVGHASASVRFHGWRSRPRWAVMLYSATEPPDRRALVVVDAVSGHIAEDPYVEDVYADV